MSRLMATRVAASHRAALKHAKHMHVSAARGLSYASHRRSHTLHRPGEHFAVAVQTVNVLWDIRGAIVIGLAILGIGGFEAHAG